MRKAVPQRGEVWRVDLGLAAKVRPCLVLTDPPADNELALITVAPHTTALRGNPWEFACEKNFLAKGAFHLQNIQSVSVAKFEERLGRLATDDMTALSKRLGERLSI